MKELLNSQGKSIAQGMRSKRRRNGADQETAIRNFMRFFRVRNAMTQSELATKVKSTRQTVISIERGGSIRLEMAVRIAEALGVSLGEMFKYQLATPSGKQNSVDFAKAESVAEAEQTTECRAWPANGV